MKENAMIALLVLLMAAIVAVSAVSLIEVKKANEVIDEIIDYRVYDSSN